MTALQQVKKEPCHCVRCGMCNGHGHIRVNDPLMDYELEPCEDCGGTGIVEVCDRCHLLDELFDAEQPA